MSFPGFLSSNGYCMSQASDSPIYHTQMDREPTIGGTKMESAKTGEHYQGSLDPDQRVSYNADSSSSPAVFDGWFACQAALRQSHMARTPIILAGQCCLCLDIAASSGKFLIAQDVLKSLPITLKKFSLETLGFRRRAGNNRARGTSGWAMAGVPCQDSGAN